ncbi:HD domain-containing phosphohydrolase [Treponema pectinovorum]|uniref:HD domain-containing phosphohydrolase n=1 Tax=Treponema pectinovorum TaxID=164 RepID=UPI0011C8D98D|nr:HD domain-containing phosphohydrolase [Treponema pectinovorum]
MRSSTKGKKLQTIIKIERLLGEIQDFDVLLERILTEARRMVRADAGSIYVVEDDRLKIKYAQNSTQLKKLPKGSKLPYVAFSFPISEKSIAGYTVVSGQIVNLKDAYHIPPEAPYSFNIETDLATGYKTVSMLCIPLKMANGRTLGVLQIINAKDRIGNITYFGEDEELFVKHFASSATQALEHAYLTVNMIKRMQKMAQYRDPKETYQHVERVSSFAIEIYDRWAVNNNIDLDEQQKFRDNLKIAAKCHDFGKIGIPDSILKKVSPRLTDEERAVMKGHTCVGGLLFADADSSLDIMCRDVALRHHEYWNGSPKGYPGKIDYLKYEPGQPVGNSEPLKGEEIPLAARIVAIADVFDALSHRRSYKTAWSLEDSFKEVQDLSGIQFDPDLVKAFMQVKDRIIAINETWKTHEA